MSKHLFRLRDLGHAGIWRVLRNAQNFAVPEVSSGILAGGSVPLLFTSHAPLERLVLTSSIRDMGGCAVYFGPGEWPVMAYAHVAQSFFFSLDSPFCIISGMDLNSLAVLAASSNCPLVNGGGLDAHPCRLLADLALMRESQRDMDRMRIAWIGGANGLAHSLIEAAMYLPFELFMALPEWGEPNREILSFAFAAGAKIFLTREVHMAMDGAHFVYAGNGPQAALGGEIHAGMVINEAVMEMAPPQTVLLLGQETGYRVQDEVLDKYADLERARFTMRRKVQGLIWQWLLHEDEAEDGGG